MGRWKVPDIEPRRDDNCVEHAISVMRLALGYKKGLPEGKFQEKEGDVQLDEFSLRAFPRHRALFVCADECEPFGDPFWDDYLLAFVYAEPNGAEAHMVIGHPWVPKGGVLLGVLAVHMVRKW